MYPCKRSHQAIGGKLFAIGCSLCLVFLSDRASAASAVSLESLAECGLIADNQQRLMCFDDAVNNAEILEVNGIDGGNSEDVNADTIEHVDPTILELVREQVVKDRSYAIAFDGFPDFLGEDASHAGDHARLRSSMLEKCLKFSENSAIDEAFRLICFDQFMEAIFR